MDGGANGHVFRTRAHFWKYVEIDSHIRQVSGSKAKVKGMGIVIITIHKSGTILVLYPCYHMPGNPQDTIGLPALKYYGRMRSVCVETLSWVNLVTEKGDRICTPTIPYYQEKELLDYILIDIKTPTVESYTIPPTINIILTIPKSRIDLSSQYTPSLNKSQRMTHINVPTAENVL